MWNVGIVDAPIATFLTPGARPPVPWLPKPPRGTFIADPFMVETETGPVILVEGFVYGADKGYIAALTGDADGQFSAPVPVIEEPTHLSYPYIVRHDGRIYCIPETGTARDVHLYEATAFPHRWERRATLIEGFAALDATIFRHGGQWWLLCSEQDGTPPTRSRRISAPAAPPGRPSSTTGNSTAPRRIARARTAARSSSTALLP